MLFGDADTIVADGVNLFTANFTGLYNKTHNGRVGDRDYGTFTYLQLPVPEPVQPSTATSADATSVPRMDAASSFVCLTTYVYKDWRTEGLVEVRGGTVV